MKLRFVTCADIVSELIRDREGSEVYPFTPSHVEMVVAEGYLGAHYDGGVQVRPAGYDHGAVLHELFVPVIADDVKAEAYARSKIGSPYDWQAIVDFMLPLRLHQDKHLICSAFMTLTCISGQVFPFPLAVPAHAVSPRDLLLMLSGRMNIPEISAIPARPIEFVSSTL